MPLDSVIRKPKGSSHNSLVYSSSHSVTPSLSHSAVQSPRRPAAPEARLIRLLAITLLISASLLFWIQPLFGKRLLPFFGGTPALWNTCMVFFQSTLLMGYAYSYWLTRHFSLGRQMAIHGGLMACCILIMPVGLPEGWSPNLQWPALEVITLLLRTLGLPLLLVAGTAPLLQHWLHCTHWPSSRDPYFLYSASNLGSLGVLLLFPLVLEPLVSLSIQFLLWNVLFGVLLFSLLLCARQIWRQRDEARLSLQEAPEPSEPVLIRLDQRIRWLMLSLAPAMHLYGVTHYITTDLAAVPLLWVVPLAIYMGTFVLVFARKERVPFRLMCKLQPALLVPVVLSIIWKPMALFWLLYPLHVLAFFVSAMVCHQQLAQNRPVSSRLTEFYLWVGVGGVLGGSFSALLAPLIFPTVIEYPLTLVLVSLLRPGRLYAHDQRARGLDLGIPAATALVLPGLILFFENLNEGRVLGLALTMTAVCGLALWFRNRPLRFGLMIGVLVIISVLHNMGLKNAVYLERNFFGTIYISESPKQQVRKLVHGSITHGAQFTDPQRRLQPLTYYYEGSPISQVFGWENNYAPQRFCVMGLGVGALAIMAHEEDEMVFYEIDPAVKQVAENPKYFSYIASSSAEVRVELGDARLLMRQVPDQTFDLIVMDAFTSDAIPVHLITMEAMQLYRQKLKPDGVIAVHISNHFVNLEPVLGSIAGMVNLQGYIRRDPGVGQPEVTLKYPSDWVVLAGNPDSLRPYNQDPNWRPLPVYAPSWAWRDDYSNLLSVLDIQWKNQTFPAK